MEREILPVACDERPAYQNKEIPHIEYIGICTQYGYICTSILIHTFTWWKPYRTTATFYLRGESTMGEHGEEVGLDTIFSERFWQTFRLTVLSVSDTDMALAPVCETEDNAFSPYEEIGYSFVSQTNVNPQPFFVATRIPFIHQVFQQEKNRKKTKKKASHQTPLLCMSLPNDRSASSKQPS